MSKSEAPTLAGTAYYECTPCDYTARADIAIGLCPRCGNSLSETTKLD